MTKQQIEECLNFWNKKNDTVVNKTIERERKRIIDKLLKKKRLSMKQLQELQQLSMYSGGYNDFLEMFKDLFQKDIQEENQYYHYTGNVCCMEKTLYDVLSFDEVTKQLHYSLAYFNGKDFILIDYDKREWIQNGVDIKDISSTVIPNVFYYRKYKNPLW